MVKIDFVEIDGLYRYDSKTRIEFGDKNIIVGTNDSGKSSIFKAIDFFLQTLTSRTVQDKPWQSRQTHQMQIGLTLSDIEKRFLIELLGVIPINMTNGTYRLVEHDYPAHLIGKFNKICMKIIWHDTPFATYNEHVECHLEIPEFGLAVCSRASDGFVFIRPLSDSAYEKNTYGKITFKKTFGGILESSNTNPSLVIEDFAKEFSKDDKIVGIMPFPPFKKFSNKSNDHGESHILNSDDHARLQFIGNMSDMSSNDDSSHGFFEMFGSMLKNRISLISEMRNFQKVATLEETNFKNDGSNLQNFLFWLQNSGQQDNLEKLDAIKDAFYKVMQGKMTFEIQVNTRDEGSVTDIKKRRIPDTTTIKFHDPDSMDLIDFNAVGAGVRESLFLLSKCMAGDESILLDEPATNLHPLQIKSIMNQILNHKFPTAEENNQIIIITHSPVLASLDIMDKMNITRVVKTGGSSSAIQVSNEDRKWLKENLGTFHLLETKVFFTKGVILTEGPSDKMVLEIMLSYGEKLGISEQDLQIIDVGGKKSFPKFERLFKMFGIPYIILEDSDGRDLSTKRDVQKIESLRSDSDIDNETIRFSITNNLECYFATLDEKLYSELNKKYPRKPEMAYHFMNQLLANTIPDKLNPIILMLNHMSELIDPVVE